MVSHLCLSLALYHLLSLTKILLSGNCFLGSLLGLLLVVALFRWLLGHLLKKSSNSSESTSKIIVFYLKMAKLVTINYIPSWESWKKSCLLSYSSL